MAVEHSTETQKLTNELDELQEELSRAILAMLAGANSLLDRLNDETCGAALAAQDLVEMACAKAEALYLNLTEIGVNHG